MASTGPKPMPPCSGATASPARPSSHSSRYTSRVRPPALASACRRLKPKSFSIQRATASRNAFWSSVKLKSISAPQYCLRDDVLLHFVAATVDRGLAVVEVHRRQRRAVRRADVVALPARFHRLADEGQRVGPGGQHHQLGVALLDLAAADLQQPGDVERLLAA